MLLVHTILIMIHLFVAVGVVGVAADARLGQCLLPLHVQIYC